MKSSVLLLAAFGCSVFGQKAAGKVEFEVASVKPAQPMQMGMIRVSMDSDGGMLRYTNVSLKDCIRTAFRLKDFQVSGPDWIGGARFDIVAKFPSGASKDQVPEMLQALLEERFKLAVHRETKDHPIYALVVAKGGPKLQPAEVSMPDKSAEIANASNAGPRKGAMMMQMDPGGAHLKASSMTLGSLAEMISRFTERPVVDETAIQGEYDFDLAFAPETMRGMRVLGGPMPPPGAGEHPAADPPADKPASIFESVQRYGLKLEPKKAPLEMLIVDHVEKEPTEN